MGKHTPRTAAQKKEAREYRQDLKARKSQNPSQAGSAAASAVPSQTTSRAVSPAPVSPALSGGSGSPGYSPSLESPPAPAMAAGGSAAASPSKAAVPLFSGGPFGPNSTAPLGGGAAAQPAAAAASSGMSAGDLAEFVRQLHEAQLKQMEAEAKTKEVEDQAKEDKAKAQLKQLETEAKTKVAEDQAKVAEAKRKRTAADLEDAEADLEVFQRKEANRLAKVKAERRRPGNSGNASTKKEIYQWGQRRTANLDLRATRRRKEGAEARAEAKAQKRLRELQEEKDHLSGVLRKAQQGARNDVFNSTLRLLQSPVGGLVQQYLGTATRHAQAFHTTGGTADPNIPCKYTRMLFDVMKKYGVDFVQEAVDNAVAAHNGAASTGAAGGSPPAGGSGGSGGSASGWGR